MVVRSLFLSWCFFWWGFAAGTHSANKDEIRSLQNRIRIWEATDSARRDEVTSNPTLNLEKERLSQLETIVDSSALYNALAPIFAPYTVYELYRLKG
jgi:hypothetical protein